MKKIKFLYIIALIAMLAAFVVGCSSESADELVTYINDTCNDLDEDYKEVYDKYVEVTKSDDNEEIVSVLEEDIIPKSQALIEKAEEIEFNDKEIEKVHNIYIEHIKLRHSAYENVLKAVKEDNTEYIDEANNLIADADLKIEEYDDARNKLAKELGVEITEK